MKEIFSVSNIITFVLVAAAAFYFLYQKGYILANFEHLDPKEAYQQLKKDRKNIILLDVRTPEEVKTDGKIPNSILIPLNKLADNIDKLKKYKDKKIFVYCRSGNRSVAASRILSSLGFNVYNIKGGINAWKEAGLPVK